MSIKKRNRISGQFSARLIEMLESPAWRVLSLSARRIIDRLEIEHAHHGGNDNGRLPVTKENFIDYGVSHDQIAPATREAEALGFIRVTERGRGGNAEYRKPSLFFLTFAHGRDSRVNPPTHDWRKIKTIEEAQSIACAARANKDPDAVRFAQRRAARKKPVLETRTETPNSPVLETRTTGSVRKLGPLSISRVGSPRYVATATPPYAGYSSLPLELRLAALGLSREEAAA